MRPQTWLVTLFLCAAGVLLLGANDFDTILLQTERAQQGTVKLEHKVHSMDRSIPCTRCHHNMAEVGTPKCSQCHTLAGQEGVRNLETAYHDACLGCHKTPPEKTKPPTECEGCHTGKAAG